MWMNKLAGGNGRCAAPHPTPKFFFLCHWAANVMLLFMIATKTPAPM